MIVERPVAGHLIDKVHSLPILSSTTLRFSEEFVYRLEPLFGTGMKLRMPCAGFAKALVGMTPPGKTHRR